ncbi:hypothetical protein [Arthrobacter sp. ok362]|uniref:LGFP repeat-containing protein n=1 Tax=Arthrobacter sp. ok362 TaxID=1761745 RepID=UPI000B84C663
MHWSPATGAFATWGPIRATWGSLGYERGRLGYPAAAENCDLVNGACSQRFQNGTITWSAAQGSIVLP